MKWLKIERDLRKSRISGTLLNHLRTFKDLHYTDNQCDMVFGASKIRRLTSKNDGICELFETTTLSCWELGDRRIVAEEHIR